MTRKPSDKRRSPACPLCRHGRKECPRKSPNERCRNCKTLVGPTITKGSDNNEAEREKTFKQAVEDFMQGVSEDTSHPTILQAHTTSREVNISLSFSGRFAAENTALVSALNDTIYNEFAIQLTSKYGDSRHIKNASLIGGYLHFLFSAEHIRPQVSLQKLGGIGDNVGMNFTASFRLILISQIQTLVHEILAAARDDAGQEIFTYAATAILYEQVASFRLSLKLGELSKHVLSDFADPFISWFSSLELQLKEAIAAGCGKFPHWLSVVHGSINLLPRKYAYLSVSVLVDQKNDEDGDLQHTPPTEEWKSVDRNKFTNPIALGSPTRATEVQHFDMEGEILGAISPVVGGLSKQIDTSQNSFDQNIDPLLLEPTTFNWEPQVTTPALGYSNSPTVTDKTINESPGMVDPSLYMADSTMSNPFDDGFLEPDLGHSFDAYDMNFEIHETLSVEANVESNAFHETFNASFLCSNGPVGHSFTSA